MPTRFQAGPRPSTHKLHACTYADCVVTTTFATHTTAWQYQSQLSQRWVLTSSLEDRRTD